MKWFRYLIREIFNNRAFSLLFILNLSLGLVGFMALDAFKVSLDSTIQLRSKAVLGADFGLSSRQPLGPQIRETLKQEIRGPYRLTETLEMVSMVANAEGSSRLVQLKVVESLYPFYGEMELEEGGIVSEKSYGPISEKPAVWIYPELKRQLGVRTGDFLKIGEQSFQVADVIKADGAAGLSTNMAPRIYLSRNFLESTQLLRKGSIAWHTLLYELPGVSNEELKELRNRVFKKLENPEIRVYTHENVSQQMATLLNRLNDFLGLSSLVALFLATVGSAFLFRSYFRARIPQVATLMSLGAHRRFAFSYYLIQISILGLISSLMALLGALILVPGLGWITEGLLPFPVILHINPLSLLFGVGVGTFGSAFLCLPILVSLKDIQIKNLLNLKDSPPSSNGFWSFLASLPALLLFSGLSIWLAHSYQVGLLFVVSFLGAALLLVFLSSLLFRLLYGLLRPSSLGARWALRDLARKPATTLMAFVAIGLGALLLNIVPQVRATLAGELERPEQSKLPSLFMFDIQEEQVSALKNILKQEGLPLDRLSPTVRARLVKLNGKNFDKGKGRGESFSREEESEMRFRNRGFNLSYRAELSEAERIVEGKPFSGSYEEDPSVLPEISVEKRFAKRLGFKIGDTLDFEIESVPVSGRITNIREVRWTSFQPNFFIQFQPGVLEMAPKTFIATIPGIPSEKKFAIQDRLVKELPNISIVDVSRIVERINSIMEQMSWALLFMSILSLFSGFVVIFSIANHQARSRGWEIGLLKSLGADFKDIQNQFLWQFGFIGFWAISLGAGLSLIMSFIFSLFLFDGVWLFDWQTPLLSLVLGTGMSLWVTWIATHRALKTPGRQLFMGS